MSVFKGLLLPIKSFPVVSFTFLSWLTMVLFSAYYCYLYGVIYAQKEDFSCYLKWAIWSWCVWFILIPFVFKKIHNDLRQQQKTWMQQFNQLSKLGAMLCMIALSVQLMGTWVMGDDVIKDIYYYFPTNIKIFIVTTLMAFVFSNKKHNDITEKKRINDLVLLKCLNHHNQKITINVNDIDRLSTCGNYVQIHCDEALYLKRITMKIMEQKLKDQPFIRIHRSHMINKNIIDDLFYKKGKLLLLTSSNDELPIGRSYKNNLARIFHHRMDFRG